MDKKEKNEKLQILRGRLEFRQKLFMEWAFVDKRLLTNVDRFLKETHEIEQAICDIARESEQKKDKG